MHTHTETSSTWRWSDPEPYSPPAQAEAECDLCGRPARHETAFEHVHHRDDEVEIALVCRECELGTD